VLGCDWLHSVSTKSLVCKRFFLTGIPLFRSVSEDYALFASQKTRFPSSRPDDVSSHPDAHLSILPAVWTTCHNVWMLDRLKHHPSGRRGFLSGPFTVSRSFCSSLHPSGRLSSSSGSLTVFDQASDSFQVQIREDCCNHPDDVDSRPDVLIHKARIEIQIQSSGRQSAWF
jgi:hypothetical protein